jgi:hypothetical protein
MMNIEERMAKAEALSTKMDNGFAVKRSAKSRAQSLRRMPEWTGDLPKNALPANRQFPNFAENRNVPSGGHLAHHCRSWRWL